MKNSHEIAYKLIEELRDYAADTTETYIKLLIYDNKEKELNELWDMYHEGDFSQLFQIIWKDFIEFGVGNIQEQLEDIKHERAEELISKLQEKSHIQIKEFVDLADQKKLNEMWNMGSESLSGWHNKLLLESNKRMFPQEEV